MSVGGFTTGDASHGDGELDRERDGERRGERGREGRRGWKGEGRNRIAHNRQGIRINDGGGSLNSERW